MTPQQLVEIVKIQSPETPVTYIEIQLLNAFKDFADRTRLLRTSVTLNAASFNASMEYTLGATVNAVEGLELFDANGKYSTTPIRYAIYDNRKLKLFNEFGEEITALPSGISTIRLWYIAIPAALTEISSIPEQYHEALCEKVLAKLSRVQKDYNGYQIAIGEYNRYIADAIKFSNKHIQRGNYQFRKDEF